MTQKELDVILEKHKKWLNHEKGGERADLRGSNLRGSDLRDSDLSYSNLSNSDLSYSNLSNSNLRGSNLSNSNLRGSNLKGSNLSYSDLRDSNLKGSNLSYSELSYSNLRDSDLSYSDLKGSELSYSNLRDSDLSYSDLRDSDLSYSDLKGSELSYSNLSNSKLSNAKNIPYIPMACPEEGAFYGYKKVSVYIVKLFIPKDAKRSSATSRKCRCSYAKVVSITLLDGSKTETKELVNTQYSPNVAYKVGEYVYPDKFDENRWNECSHGIHFFINRQEAVDY